MEDVHMVYRVLAVDPVLEHLAVAREIVKRNDKQAYAVLGAAWTALEWVNGTIDAERLLEIQRMIRLLDLVDRVEELSQRNWSFE
jgi:hypothetical protein